MKPKKDREATGPAPTELELRRDQEGEGDADRKPWRPSHSSGGGGSPFDLSDLPWRVGRVPWALREGMLV